jgi:formylglycine-generating enzyme required for sulfatase activity
MMELQWVNIPFGQVTLKDTTFTKGGTYNVSMFQIAKYPVTVEQYAQFVQDNGYTTETYWTRAGWEWRSKKKIILPGFWEDERLHQPDHPIVGVSWYEAIAFCHWLSAKTGGKITLPTQQQWQRAAQGDDGYLYPWGNDWDGRKCNNNIDENLSLSTTPVTSYPQGVSPYGVFDMAGNVWEWLLTQWVKDDININGHMPRRARGGSWDIEDSEIAFYSCAFCGWNSAYYRDEYIGFRIARSS